MQTIRILGTIAWNFVAPPAVLLLIAGLFWLLFSFPLVLFLLALVLLWVTPWFMRRAHATSAERVQLLPPEGDYQVALFQDGYRDGRHRANDRTLALLEQGAGNTSAYAGWRRDTMPTDAADLGNLDRQVLGFRPAEFWRDHLAVPVASASNLVTLAMADPDDVGTREDVGDIVHRPLHVLRATPRKILSALERAYEDDFSENSRSGLLRRRPEDSAFRTVTGPQRIWGALLIVAMAAGLFVWKLAVLIVLNVIAQFFYLGLTFYKLGLLFHLGSQERNIEVPVDREAPGFSRDLPLYSVLVPVYREARVLPTLVGGLSELDYPHDRLDVKILLEADDVETIDAANRLDLPEFISVVVVPPSEPRTKPKACNYGLHTARGEYLVVYDAEDIPESDQLLKAVAAFRQSGPEVACVQAKLVYFNRNQNLLTRWFAAEYLMWFDIMLPSLHAAELPIPLGGTSNHFRTDVLRQVGAWDPYNVAEDADLGVRLHKSGYRTAVVDSFTYEEATSRIDSWIKQRSRWVKGYMQTWLVHMRHPIELRRSLGTRGFIGFQIVVGGTPFTLLLNPVLALLTTMWYLTQAGWIQALLPGWIYLAACTSLVLGNLAFTFVNMVAVARRNLWEQLAWTAFSPIYWTVMSIAAWKALLQLITRPSYWEKTDHGFTAPPIVPGLGGSDGAHGTASA